MKFFHLGKNEYLENGGIWKRRSSSRKKPGKRVIGNRPNILLLFPEIKIKPLIIKAIFSSDAASLARWRKTTDFKEPTCEIQQEYTVRIFAKGKETIVETCGAWCPQLAGLEMSRRRLTKQIRESSLPVCLSGRIFN